MTRRRGADPTDGGGPAGSVQLFLFEVIEDRPVEELPVGVHPAPAQLEAEQGSEERAPEEPPVDHFARVRIATALDETVFAVAGAGSGKTRHLVERVLNVLLTGKARIDQLAVITFTEAAAAELRERIGEELDRVLTAASDPLAAQRAADALGALDGAAITTLHGFARRILSAFPFDAGLPPTFDVLDEARSLADLDEHWVDTVDALLADGRRARAVQWAIVAGANLGNLRAIVRRMGENWDRLVTRADRAGACGLPRLDPGPVARPLRRALELEPYCTDADDHLLAHLGRLRPYLAHLERAGDDELQLLRMLLWPPRRIPARTKGTAGAWGGRKPVVVALLDEAEAARQSAASRAIGAAMEVVGDALAELAVASARRRQREGRLQFHDLLVLACELVRDSAQVRAALHDEYRHLFVDEYQDTDPLQAELVTMIAAQPGERVGEVPWWRLRTTPGALFFVGDPLQSIYAFRRADVGTFLRTLQDVATNEARLVTNFRSAPGIVEWVNGVFERVVGDGEAEVQPPYRPSSAARRADEILPRAVSVVGAGADHEVPAAEARRVEAEEVAALLRRAVAEGWPVGAGGRAVQPDDIAVLVPSRTSVPALESALDAVGIDYRLESSSLVYDTREVQELLHVLHAIDDPSDSASVVAALRTPGFACGDDDLLRHRLCGGTWDYRLDPPAPVAGDDPVRTGLERLRHLHEARRWAGVSELVASVVEETRQLGAALDGRRWREEWRRLRFVLDQAREFVETSPGTLRQYLAWVDVQRDEDARVTEIVLPEADAPAVAVMTVHAAKGLEFPVVAVVGLGAALRGVTTPTVLFGGDGIELAVNKTICTSGYEAARRDEQRILERERLRLLYVALTRAQNHLVVSVHRPRRSGTTTAGVLEAALADVSHLWDAHPQPTEEAAPAPGAPSAAPAAPAPRWRRVATDGTRPPFAKDLKVVKDVIDDAEDLARWTRARERRLAARPSVVSATGIAKLAAAEAASSGGGAEAGQLGQEAAEPDDDAETGRFGDDGGAGAPSARGLWRRGRAGTARGRAVHAVLQTVDLRTGAGLEAMAKAHAAAEGVPSRWEEVAALARTALDSAIVRRAAERRFWRELYVGAPVGSGVLEGFVDLLFEGTDGLEVVDYKTDEVRSDEEVDRLAARYRLQGAAYAAAVRAATGRAVRRCTFLFLRAGEAVARSVDDLDQAVAEVEAVMRTGS
jgi:ATP-dependent helicase/nuclease subunit A